MLVSIDDLPVHRFAPCVLLFVRVCLSAVALVSFCFAFVWRLLIGPLVTLVTMVFVLYDHMFPCFFLLYHCILLLPSFLSLLYCLFAVCFLTFHVNLSLFRSLLGRLACVLCLFAVFSPGVSFFLLLFLPVCRSFFSPFFFFLLLFCFLFFLLFLVSALLSASMRSPFFLLLVSFSVSLFSHLFPISVSLFLHLFRNISLIRLFPRFPTLACLSAT